MAQKKSPKKAKRARSYGTDSILLHMVSGGLLVGLGALVILAVIVRMPTNVFVGLRSLCHGLTGALAVVLPVFLIWGGILVFWGIQSKPPVRPYLLTLAIFAMVLACASLLTYSGAQHVPLLDYFMTTTGFQSDYQLFLAKSYVFGSEYQASGGVIGMLLAWPLWQVMGTVMAAVVFIVLAVVLFLCLIRFDVRKVSESIAQASADRRAAMEKKHQEQQRQELEWQKKKAAEERVRQQQAAEAPKKDTAAANQPQNAPQTTPYGFKPTDEEVHGLLGTKRGLLKNLFHPADDADAPTAPGRPRRREMPVAPAAQPVQQPPVYPPVYSQPGQPVYQQPTGPVPGYPQGTYQPTGPVPGYPQGAFQPTGPAPVYPQGAFQPTGPAPVYPQGAFQQPTGPVPAYPQGAYQQPAVQETAPAASTGASHVYQPDQVKPAKPTRSEVKASAAAEKPAAKKADLSWREQVEQRKNAIGGHSKPKDPNAIDGSDPSSYFVIPPDDEPEETPALQKPKPSWTSDADRPPWEEAAPFEETQPASAAADEPQPATPIQTEPAPAEPAVEIPYVFPDLDLLNLPVIPANQSLEVDRIRSQKLEETLLSFKIKATVKHITHGPAISRFELELAAGIKVSKVTDLAQNIAMNMEVKSVRIEAPIPGKSLVGVEIPNISTTPVTLREVLESDVMHASTKSPLVVALGRDIAGTPIVCNLARMPHLLIAGATGSGKSVCINTMINSLLYRCSPKEVRLLLVDPKVVELQCYNGVPHLLMPVVSDPHKAAGALAWAVGEMMDRYNRFKERGVRAIDGYNASLEEGEERMPRIVIIIDELADLMMTCKRDVEDHICRLAQLARAAGIHLVVATQRPSVDVITGLIKANIPSRIAFKVSSNVDSRTILDKIGAEQLLGYGDMLYQPTGEFSPIRIQGCFLSDDEVNRITDFIRENSPGTYDADVMEQVERLTDSGDGSGPEMPDMSDSGTGDGSLLLQAIEMAVNDRQVSTSFIQRRLKIGYARAGRLVDQMEELGIVSQKDGAKPRMCLISREEFERMKENGTFG